MTASAKLTFIPDLVEEHYEELQFLWSQRRTALRSSAYTPRQLAALEERIDGHADGMLVIGERIVDFADPALRGDQPLPAFAAAFALLRFGAIDAVRRVGHAFETARGEKVQGLRDALANVPAAAPLQGQLTTLFLTAAPPLAAAAGEVLAFHGAAGVEPRYLERLIRAEEPAARAAAWRLAAYCGVSVTSESVEAALRDDDPMVKSAALTAAAWTGSAAFPAYARAIAATPTPDAIDPLTVFAAVAPPEEYQIVAGIATDPAVGPRRFTVVGAFGHPYFVDLLINEMGNPDPASAVAAGAAFFKMTGRDVESKTRVKTSPDGKPPADEFEAEFQDDVFLPDPDLARKQWKELAPTLAHSPRICRGMDVSQPLSREQFALLDMESRYEYCLRMRLFSGWQGTPLVLERYPQRF